MKISVKANSVRAISYLPSGKQCSTWLRAGEYQHKGIVSIKVSDLGQVSNEKAAMLISDRENDRGPFYVRPNVAECDGVSVI